MAKTVNQPTANPTNKLTAAIVATAVVGVARVACRHFAPDWADDNMWDAMLPVAVFAFGYIIKDAPNT